MSFKKQAVISFSEVNNSLKAFQDFSIHTTRDEWAPNLVSFECDAIFATLLTPLKTSAVNLMHNSFQDVKYDIFRR